MARERKQPEENFVKVSSYNIRRAFEHEKGRIFFDMELNGITIYGCMVVAYENKEFISFPSQKGKDGNYYNIVYARLSNSDQNKIIESVYDFLDK